MAPHGAEFTTHGAWARIDSQQGKRVYDRLWIGSYMGEIPCGAIIVVPKAKLILILLRNTNTISWMKSVLFPWTRQSDYFVSKRVFTPTTFSDFDVQMSEGVFVIAYANPRCLRLKIRSLWQKCCTILRRPQNSSLVTARGQKVFSVNSRRSQNAISFHSLKISVIPSIKTW